MVTVPEVAVNVAVVAPAATVTDAGTVTKALLLDSETAAPDAGAACDKVTVQLEVAPLPRIAGTHRTELTTARGIRETVAVLVEPL